ncbi:uncharacterized protein LOC117171456 isoform X2 [Belonocnema kinseyi]|uniref:uncharacterized protein LOC117171456 isoform X2 n=1 Tax=Belonocnema kinseyi TaxID=2817044 RepID=UPI00143CF510|nr:uncharacterized protein LOC117171456 isoform X2 [Belonocnema kinseyi]
MEDQVLNEFHQQNFLYPESLNQHIQIGGAQTVRAIRREHFWGHAVQFCMVEVTTFLHISKK